MIEAVIFDFDGLILDTETPQYQSWQEIYQSHGCYLPLEQWAPLLGGPSTPFDPHEYLETQLGYSIDRKEIIEKRLIRVTDLISSQPILPGVEQYISDAKRLNLQLAVTSSSSQQWVTGHLTRLNLIKHFDIIRCRDDVMNIKPHPELYISTLSALDIQADEAIVLEDSPNGISAATLAGIITIAVPNSLTKLLSVSHADLQLNSLAELPLEQLISKVIQEII